MLIPCVLPHVTQPPVRWSNRHDERLLTDAYLPFTEEQTSSTPHHSRLIAETETGDIVYVSSENTVSVLILGCGDDVIKGDDDVTPSVALLPGVCDVQVFETRLSVIGISSSSAATEEHPSIYLHTLYELLQLTPLFSRRYSLDLVRSFEDPILDVVLTSQTLHLLTTSQLLCLDLTNHSTLRGVDLTGLWREEDPCRAVLVPNSEDQPNSVDHPTSKDHATSKDHWYIVERSAIHRLTAESHEVLMTIPTPTLPYTEHFLAAGLQEEGRSLTVATTSYLLTLDTSDSSIRDQVAHNVQSAHSATITRSHQVAVTSPEQFSYFPYPATYPASHLLQPLGEVRAREGRRCALLTKAYSTLPLPSRNLLSRRLSDGWVSVYLASCGGVFLLSEHKDLLYSGASKCDGNAVWDRWVASVQFTEGYVAEHKEVNATYRQLLAEGLRLQRGKREPRTDWAQSLEYYNDRVKDKYTQSLINKWFS